MRHCSIFKLHLRSESSP